MAWRRRLRKASFRGVRFNITEANSSFGRRIVGHEFPKRDEPYSEDLGRKTREFSFEAFINGFDYMRLRDKLIAACEKEGPGKLVHPYYGNRDVVCTDCELLESTLEGGVARFRLSFREAGSLKFPTTKSNPKGILSLLGIVSDDSAITNFLNNFDVASYPQHVVDAAQAQVDAFSDALEVSTGFITSNADSIADLAHSITNLRDDVDGLLNAPALLAERMKNAIGLLVESVTNKRESLDAYKHLFTFGSSDTFSTRNTASQNQINTNKRAISNLAKQFAISQASQAIVDVSFSSVSDAVTERQFIYDAIAEQESALEISDDVYQNMQQFRAELQKGVPGEDQDLPSVIKVTPIATTNSIVLAYNLYGTLDREQDIVDRNSLEHPGLIVGGEELEVLNG